MSTVIEPNAPQGSPSSFDITGATPAAAETLGLNARRVIGKRYSLKDAQEVVALQNSRLVSLETAMALEA